MTDASTPTRGTLNLDQLAQEVQARQQAAKGGDRPQWARVITGKEPVGEE